MINSVTRENIMVTTKRVGALAAALFVGGAALAPSAASAGAAGAVAAGPAPIGASGFILPGDWMAAGFEVTVAGAHGTDTVVIEGAVATVPLFCWSGATATVDVRIPSTAVVIPAGDGGAHPTAAVASPGSYQASVRVPDACNGGPMFVSDRDGASYTASVAASDPAGVAVRFHAVDGGSLARQLLWMGGLGGKTSAPGKKHSAGAGAGSNSGSNSGSAGTWPPPPDVIPSLPWGSGSGLDCSSAAQNPSGLPACRADWTAASATKPAPPAPTGNPSSGGTPSPSGSPSSGGTGQPGSTGGGAPAGAGGVPPATEGGSRPGGSPPVGAVSGALAPPGLQALTLHAPLGGVSLPGAGVDALAALHGAQTLSAAALSHAVASRASILDGLLGPVPVLVPILGEAVMRFGEALSWWGLGAAALAVSGLMVVILIRRRRWAAGE